MTDCVESGQGAKQDLPILLFLSVLRRGKKRCVSCNSDHMLYNYCASHIQITGRSPEFSISGKISYITEQEGESSGTQFKQGFYLGILFTFFFLPLLPLIPLPFSFPYSFYPS